MILSVRMAERLTSRAIAPRRAAVNPARACDVAGAHRSTCGVNFENPGFRESPFAHRPNT